MNVSDRKPIGPLSPPELTKVRDDIASSPTDYYIEQRRRLVATIDYERTPVRSIAWAVWMEGLIGAPLRLRTVPDEAT